MATQLGAAEKRRRLDETTSSTSREGKHLTEMVAWLVRSGAQGLADSSGIRFGPSERCGGSLGCFGLRDFKEGDVMFSIPQQCLFGLQQSSDTPLAHALRKYALLQGDPSLVTSELLIWLHMIKCRDDSHSDFFSYFNSLDRCSPTPLSWPLALQSTALAETTLGLFLNDVRQSLQRHFDFVVAAHAHYAAAGDAAASAPLDPAVLSLDALRWARGHYLARRYPGKHALDGSERGAEGLADGREPGLESLGVLVPVLDILNHDDQHEYLQLRVAPAPVAPATGSGAGGGTGAGAGGAGLLQIVCHCATRQGDELWSNYGELSNERLLFAYGFSIDDNPHDTVTVRPTLPPGHPLTQQGAGVSLGSHYLERGGMAGVPALLWKALALSNGRQEYARLFTAAADDEGEDKDEDEDEDEEPLEVGLDEVDALLGFARRKLQALQLSEADAEAALSAHGAGPLRGVCKCIAAYRRGQFSILSDLVRELQEATEGAEEEGEGEGEEGEEEEEEGEEERE